MKSFFLNADRVNPYTELTVGQLHFTIVVVAVVAVIIGYTLVKNWNNKSNLTVA